MLKNATLRQIATLNAVARLGSISRAAEELHLTQPALSIQLKLLEQAAGTPIVERIGRGVRLTDAGQLLAGYAARLLELWREAGDELAAQRGIFSGTLRVGAVTTAEYLLPPLLVTFVDRNPQVQVKLAVGNRDEIVRMLAAHEVDVVIMGRPPRELRTVSIPFARHPMAFMVGPAHPMASRDRVALSELVDVNLLVRERGSGTRTTLERLFKDAGLNWRVGSEMSSNEAIKQMCASGFGVGFLSLHTCGLELDAGRLRLLPVADFPIERHWYVMHLASRQVPKVSAAFEDYLGREGQEAIDAQLRRSRALSPFAAHTEKKPSAPRRGRRAVARRGAAAP